MSCFFFPVSAFCTKTLKRHFWTRVWSAQHPNAGQNIQQLLLQFLARIPLSLSFLCFICCLFVLGHKFDLLYFVNIIYNFNIIKSFKIVKRCPNYPSLNLQKIEISVQLTIIYCQFKNTLYKLQFIGFI